MTELHERWMDEPGPTDVLSFPMDELRPGRVDRDDDGPTTPGLLGDVVLCPAVARRQAQVAGHSMQDELELLCTHGILHLLGFDHAEPDEETRDVRPPARAARRLAIGATGARGADGGRSAHEHRATSLLPVAVASADRCWPALCAAADAALSRVSRVHVDDYLRDERRGAAALRRVIADPPRYLNVVLLLRVACRDDRRGAWSPSWASAGSADSWARCSSPPRRWSSSATSSSASAPRTLGRQHADRVALSPRRCVVRARQRARPAAAAADPARQRADAGPRLPRRPVRHEAELRELVDLAEASRSSRATSGR